MDQNLQVRLLLAEEEVEDEDAEPKYYQENFITQSDKYLCKLIWVGVTPHQNIAIAIAIGKEKICPNDPLLFIRYFLNAILGRICSKSHGKFSYI